MEITSLYLKGYKYLKFSDINEIRITNANKIEIIIGTNGGGKALVHGTKVRVPFGWKNIEDIKLGDKVIAVDGTSSNVIGVYPQGIEDIYRVNFVDGRYIDTDEHHLWEVLHRDSNNLEKLNIKVLSTLQIQKILKNTVLRKKDIYIPLITPENGSDIPLPVEPYTLGVLIGDGCLSKYGSVHIDSDLEIINKVQDINFDHLRMTITKKPGTIGYYYRARLKFGLDGTFPIRDGLYQLGLMGKRSWEKFIPEIYFNASYNQRLALLQGLCDTDGYVADPLKSLGRSGKHSISGHVEFSTSSPYLAYDVAKLVYSLGGKCNIRKRETHYTRKEEQYKGIKFPGRTNYRIYVKLQNPKSGFTLERKKCRLADHHQYTKSWKLKIVSVEKLDYQKECTCIVIDHPRKLFVTENYIVTHNSSLLRAYSPTPMQSTLFDKQGSKELILKHKDHNFNIGYDASAKMHTFFIDDGPNLNESGTTQVQEELVEKHLGYTKLIEKLIYNKMKMTQMTPAARMDFLISINPVNIKFMKDKYAKLLSQGKKYKNQLEYIQTRVSEYKTAMMDEIEYSKYLANKETLQQFDDDVIKTIYRYEALAKQCSNDISPIRDMGEYKKKYLGFKHLILQMSGNSAKSWVIPDNLSLSEMIMTKGHLEHQLNDVLLKMTATSKEIDELENVIAKSNQVDITALEEQYNNYKTSLKKYTDMDWNSKVIIDWPPASDTDIKYTELHKLHTLINDCNNYYTNKHIWHTKTFKYQKDRYLRIHSRIQDISNKIQYTQNQISDLDKQIKNHTCSSPDKECTSKTCSFKIQYNCILGDLQKKYQELKSDLDTLNKSYLKWKNINSKMYELLEYQSVFLDNKGILNLMYECILNISPLFSKVFVHGVDTLVDMINTNIDFIFTNVKNVLQDSNDYHEKLMLENKVKELDLTIKAQEKNMSLVFATKKVKEDYETIKTLDNEVNNLKSTIATYERYIAHQTLFNKAIDHTDQILKELDKDMVTYTNMAKYDAFTGIVEQMNKLHSHVSNILRDMDTVISTQKRTRELYNKEIKQVAIFEKEIEDIQTMCKVLDPYSGLPAVYTKKHLSKILQNVNYFISQVFTYPLIVSLQEDAKEMKYKFVVQVDTVNAGDISTCSDGQMEMIDLAFTLAIMIALGIHTTYPIFLDEIGRCLDVTHMQRLLEMLHNLVEQGYINQMFIINHQAVMIGGFESADVVCLRSENVVLPEKYNTTVTIN